LSHLNRTEFSTGTRLAPYGRKDGQAGKPKTNRYFYNNCNSSNYSTYIFTCLLTTYAISNRHFLSTKTPPFPPSRILRWHSKQRLMKIHQCKML